MRRFFFLLLAGTVAAGLAVSALAAAGPRISQSTHTLNFGQRAINDPSPAMSVTFTNKGADSAQIGALTFSGDTAYFFNQSNGCPEGAGLSPDGSCTVSVYFWANTPGRYSGSASISFGTKVMTFKFSGTAYQP